MVLVGINMQLMSPSKSLKSPHLDKEQEMDQEQSSPLLLFPWKDVKAYQQRLLSFHHTDTNAISVNTQRSVTESTASKNDWNSCLCLPVELSPIICSRFGWRRSTVNLAGSNKNISNSNNDVVMLSCQDGANCKAVICIKYNPLLSRYSKRKLTLLYRQMLATNHDDGCSFQYDALSWLKKETTNNNTDTDSSIHSGQFIVPPFLIHLSKEYQMIQSCSNISNDTSLVSRLIRTQSERLGKYCYNISRNKEESNDVVAPSSLLSAVDYSKYNSDIQSIMMIISSGTVERLVDIANTSLPPSTSLSVNTEGESAEALIDNILQNMLSHLTEKQNEEETLSSLLEEEKLNDKHNASSLDLAEELKRKLQDEYYGEERFDDARKKEKSKYSSKGTLLLSLFGWRLAEGIEDVSFGKETKISPITTTAAGTDTLTTNSTITAGSNESSKAVDPINSPVYVKCDLCLNCSPLPREFLQCIMSDKSKETATQLCSVGGGRSEPPQKKRKISSSCKDNNINDSSDESNMQKIPTAQVDDQGEEEVVVMSTNRSKSSTHRFDVINSHRYYCPFVSGFHQMGDGNNDKNNNEMKTGGPDGTSDPCWEIIWKHLLCSTAKCSSDSNKGAMKHQNIEEKFLSIRDKIRSSLLGYKMT